jgi:hypothetical protein
VDAALTEDETPEQYILRRAVVGRRMLSKAQIAYLAAKDYAIQLKKGKEWQLKNLKQFGDSPEVPENGTSGEFENPAHKILQGIGQKYGVSRGYAHQAYRLMQADPQAFELLGESHWDVVSEIAYT